MTVSPWRNPNATAADSPELVFEPNPQLPELRRLDKEGKNKPIGVETCLGKRVYPANLPAISPPQTSDPAAKPVAGTRWVVPSGTAIGPGIHKKLEAAISEAEPGDIILIKHDGPLPIELLNKAFLKVTEAGFRLVHADVTVIIEKPKLAPHLDAMEEKLAGALLVGSGHVSVKAKTNEGMGWIGRGEGVAVMAVATLQEPGSAS